MKELAPQTKDGSYARPIYNLKGVIGSPEFPVSHPSQLCLHKNDPFRKYFFWQASLITAQPGEFAHACIAVEEFGSLFSAVSQIHDQLVQGFPEPVRRPGKGCAQSA